MNELSQHEAIPVTVCIAVSESGRFMFSIADTNWIQEEEKHQAMLAQIRSDKQLWAVKYVKTRIPYPITREEQQ